MEKVDSVSRALYAAACWLTTTLCLLAVPLAGWSREEVRNAVEAMEAACRRRGQGITPGGIASRLILAEDRRFLLHHGVDPIAIGRAAMACLGGSRQGGSTITMQLVRTLTGRYEPSLRRKLRECILATELASRVSRVAVLRAYIVHAYVGHPGCGWESFKAKGLLVDGDGRSAFVAAIRYPIPARQFDRRSPRRRRRESWIEQLVRSRSRPRRS